MKNRKRIGSIPCRMLYRCAILLFLAFLSALQADEFRNTGTTGYTFLNLPVTSRYASLGETGISMPDLGSEALFVNPALGAFSNGTGDISITYGSWYLDTRQNAIAAVKLLPRVGMFGISIYQFDFGSTERTRNFAPEEVAELQPGDLNTYRDLGTYSSGGLALTLHFARRTTMDFAFGLSLSYIRESIAEYSSDNVSFDIGFMYRTGVGSIRVASYLKNFGLEGVYEYEKFKLPQRLSLGISGEVLGDLEDPTHVTLLLEAVNPNDIGEHLHAGTEVVLAGILQLRGGYKFGYDAEGLTLGLGTDFTLKGRKVSMDLAYMNHDYLQSTVRTSLGMEF